MSCVHNKYQMWIASYLADGNPITGMCQQVCERMREYFPELELRGGYANTELGSDVHYWLRTSDGLIIDPTESQYGCLFPENYEDAGTTDALVLLQRFLDKEWV